MNEDQVTWAEIVEIVGEKAALELSLKRGGRDLYVPTPERLGASSPATVILGAEAARALAASRLGGSRITVPNGPGKHEEVRRLRQAGATISQIAAQTRYTERHVYDILAGEPPPEPPLLAFLRGS